MRVTAPDTGAMLLSEPPPPPYNMRELVCAMCGKTFEPSPLEAESLAELELTFGLKPNPMTAVCEDCGGRSIQ